jgi:hypothetical protein
MPFFILFPPVGYWLTLGISPQGYVNMTDKESDLSDSLRLPFEIRA